MSREIESGPATDETELADANRQNWPLHIGLFLLTLLSVFHAGARDAASMAGANQDSWFASGFVHPRFLALGASFALPLIAILLTHELGHFFLAKLHRVPASLPYFLPLPFLGWGTLGAVISMRGAIRTRKALFDIGAAGPIAGLCVAIPVLCWGLAHSPVEVLPPTGYQQEGQSLLYWVLKRFAVGHIPPGSDVMLHPTALAGWVGLWLTMINLLPWGQLDGGHIAFALFGERQHVFARWLRRGLPLLFLGNFLYFAGRPLLLHEKVDWLSAVGNSLFWLVWFFVLGVIGRVSGGNDHPPCEPSELGLARRLLAWGCLLLFVGLFMPTPMATY